MKQLIPYTFLAFCLHSPLAVAEAPRPDSWPTIVKQVHSCDRYDARQSVADKILNDLRQIKLADEQQVEEAIFFGTMAAWDLAVKGCAGQAEKLADAMISYPGGSEYDRKLAVEVKDMASRRVALEQAEAIWSAQPTGRHRR